MSLTQSELESRLLAAANSLRGPVDPADFKQYVFPLLFLKRLSDNWDAEQAQAEGDYAPNPVPAAADADYHRFDMPNGCHWSDLRTNKDLLPEHALNRLIEIFSGIPLDPATVSHDMLGNAYEYLLREFAEASGKKAGEFFTPRAVVRLLTRLLDPQAGESIYDPACGSAGMLIEALNEVADAGGDTRTLRLYGQEVSLTTSAIARMNLFMHDIEDFKVIRGDTLREPKFQDAQGALQRFDVVIANPPFILKNWGSEVWEQDPHDRAFCGVPPAGNADWAWIQHMIRSMSPEGGRVGVVMSHGALFRPDREAKIRACVAGGGLLKAVVGLPPSLFYSTSIRACLLIFDSGDQGEGVLFADASRRFVKGRNRNFMEEADVKCVVDAVQKRTTGDHESVFTRLVSQEELQARDYDLRLNHYLQSAVDAGVGSGLALDEVDASRQAFMEAAAEFDARRKVVLGG